MNWNKLRHSAFPLLVIFWSFQPIFGQEPSQVPSSSKMRRAINAIQDVLSTHGLSLDSARSKSTLTGRKVERSPEQIFKSANPSSNAADAIQWHLPFGFNKAARLMLYARTFANSDEDGIDCFEQIANWKVSPKLRGILLEILGFAGKVDTDADARDFVTVLARRQAEENKHARQTHQSLPANPLPGGEYWDLASVNAADLMRQDLDPATRYRFFDISFFVVECLKETVRHLGLTNVSIERQDIRHLAPPTGPLAVIRAKNTVSYVPDFEKKLEEMASWLQVGGQLILQSETDPDHRAIIVDWHAPLAEKLIRDGWRFEYQLVEDDSRLKRFPIPLDTLKFTKPGVNIDRASVATSQALWQKYLERIQTAGAAARRR